MQLYTCEMCIIQEYEHSSTFNSIHPSINTRTRHHHLGTGGNCIHTCTCTPSHSSTLCVTHNKTSIIMHMCVCVATLEAIGYERNAWKLNNTSACSQQQTLMDGFFLNTQQQNLYVHSKLQGFLKDGGGCILSTHKIWLHQCHSPSFSTLHLPKQTLYCASNQKQEPEGLGMRPTKSWTGGWEHGCVSVNTLRTQINHV